MKKFGALLCVFLVAMTLSACRAFVDDRTQTYPQDDPYEMTVFLQLKDTTVTGESADMKLTAWLGEVNRLITEMAADPDSTDVKITAVKLRTTTESDTDATTGDTFTVDLTLSNFPDYTVRKIVRPFKIYYTQTVYNPIALLPDSDTFTYIVGFTAEKRHSAVNTDLVAIQDDGTYVYLWTTGDAIEITDVYPNRPLYYLIVIAGATVLGGFVYLVSRFHYNDCKKSQKTL